ncbi:MAG: DNA pilot protein [Arizlama microvirus]|nr:MAG: DNA pilot protein [Arizlama microvirus]
MSMIAATLGAAALGGAANFFGQKKANETNQNIANQATAANQKMAREQMAFQERMSSSAYQRSMDDMQKAGLNPMLAFSQGGASSPGGASGSAATTQVQNEMSGVSDALGKGVSSAIDARRLKKEEKAVDSSTKLNTATAITQDAQSKLLTTNAATAKLNQEVLKAQLPAIKAQSRVDKKTSEFDEKAVEADSWMNRIGRVLGLVNSAASVVKPKFQFGGTNTTPNKKRGDSSYHKVDKKTGEILNDY